MMRRERWFGGSHETAFDWVRPACELDVPLEVARALYDRAIQLVADAAHARALYLRWLRDRAAAREPVAPAPVPGRQTRVRCETQNGGRSWTPQELRRLGPGKWTHTVLEAGDDDAARLPGQDAVRLAIETLTSGPGVHAVAEPPGPAPSSPGPLGIAAQEPASEASPGYAPEDTAQRDRAETPADGLAASDDPLVRGAPSLVERDGVSARPRDALRRLWEPVWDPRHVDAARIAPVPGAARAQPAERHAVTLFRREAGAVDAADPEHPTVVEALRRRGSGEPLAEPVRRDMEARLGADLRRVRVHTDEVAQRAAAAVQARAFTVGEDVFFAAGAFQPDSSGGRDLLAHELAHVVQGHRGQLPATGGPHLTAPGDAVEREADAMAREAMRAPAGPAIPVVEPPAGGVASAVIARDSPTDTTTTPAPWPAADLDAIAFWTAAQAPFGFADTEKAEAERVFNLFNPSVGAAGGWAIVNENLALYCTFADIEGGRRTADHGAIVPIFALLLSARPSVADSTVQSTIPLLWTNVRTVRKWLLGYVDLIYGIANSEPLATQLPLLDLAVALGAENEYFAVAQSLWGSEVDQVHALPGFLHFKQHAPTEWQNAAGFSTFADPICNTPTVDRVVDMVVPQIAGRGWLDMPEDGTVFWSGGDPAKTLATMMSGYQGITTPIDSARTRIDWESPPRGGDAGTLNNGPLAAILNTSPLWSMTTPSNFLWDVGGRIFFQGLSKVLAENARGIAHAVLVGAPGDNAIFLSHELPALIELKNRPVPLITGLDFLCFPKARTVTALQYPDGQPISALLQPAPAGASTDQQRNYGLETSDFTVAEAWMNQQSGSAALANRLAELRVQWQASGNAGTGPVIIIPLGDRGAPGATIDVTDDLPAHPGLQMKNVHLQVTDNATVASGSITASLAAGGAFQIPDVTYSLTPATGDTDATASNSVADRTRGLSPFGDLLAGIPIDWDVQVVDGGLAVSLALTRSIPLPGGLSISAAAGVLSYIGGDGLVGTISVTVTNGSTITGTVELSHQDGRYRIGGTLQVSGLIAGLAPFAVAMDYAGPDDWRVGLADGSSLSVSTQLFGVPVSGVIDQLAMGSASRLSSAAGSGAAPGAASGASGSQTGFSAHGTLTADLPLVGPVEAGIRIVDNRLDTVSLTAERAFQFPGSNPIVSGNVTGTATYHVQSGALEGGLSGTASVTVPSIEQPVAITFALAASPTGFTVDASLASEVEINHFLRLTELAASYDNGQLTLVGGAAVQNLGNVDASICVRIDQTGLHVEQGSATVSFGDANFGGQATFRYSETDGFGFDGHLDIQVLPGKSVELAIAYPSQGTGGAAEDGTFDASVAIPPPQGGGAGTSAAGWQLWDGVQPGAPTPLFSAPHLSIPIFSIGLATATIEIDAALLYTVAVDPLTVTGSLTAEGINLANPQQPFRTITVTGTAKSGLTGQLLFEPRVALGLSVVHPFLAGIQGGLELPVTATAGLDIQGDVALEFQPGVGLSTEQATVTAPLSFSVTATPRLFAQLEALGGIIAPPAWQSDSLAQLTLVENKQLLEVVLDLAHPDRGITVNTFNPAAPASSSPTGMPMTPRQPTMTPGAAAPASSPAVSTTTSNATGTTSGGGMDFSALLTAVSGAMPQPVRDLITTLQSIWSTIQPIVNQVVEFLNWISATIRSIFTDDEVQQLLTQVLPELASGNASNIVDAVRTAIAIGREVVQKLVAPLVQSGDVSVLRRRKNRGIFGWDEGNPDEYSYRFHIPGLLDVSGEGSDPALSTMVLFLRDQLGVPIRDLDDVQPPHMIGYYMDDNAAGDIIGSSSDAPQTLRGGEEFHNDCMSSVKGFGVTPGTTLHLYEHANREGDYTRITFGTAPAPAPTVDANGLEQRKPPTVTVNIGSGGDNASWVVIRGNQLNDKVSTVVITSSAAEPSR